MTGITLEIATNPLRGSTMEELEAAWEALSDEQKDMYRKAHDRIWARQNYAEISTTRFQRLSMIVRRHFDRLETTPEQRLKGAYERGDADAYYGRWGRSPSLRLPNDRLKEYLVPEEEMSSEEIAAYNRGMSENPSGEKDWD